MIEGKRIYRGRERASEEQTGGERSANVLFLVDGIEFRNPLQRRLSPFVFAQAHSSAFKTPFAIRFPAFGRCYSTTSSPCSSRCKRPITRQLN